MSNCISDADMHVIIFILCLLINKWTILKFYVVYSKYIKNNHLTALSELMYRNLYLFG